MNQATIILFDDSRDGNIRPLTNAELSGATVDPVDIIIGLTNSLGSIQSNATRNTA